MLDPNAHEREVRRVAEQLAELGSRQRPRIFNLSGWSDRFIARSMDDPVFRVHMFRFVDAFPALGDDEEIEEHLRSEFKGIEVPRWFDAGLGLTKNLPGGARLSAAAARRGIDRMARQFIIGTEPEEVAKAVAELWERGTGATIDLLGEHTYSEEEADRYAARLAGFVETLGASAAQWEPNRALETDGFGPVARASVSVKVSALASSFTPLCADECVERAAHRLLPVLRRANDLRVSVWFDAERYEEKELTQLLFRRVLSLPGLEGLEAGLAIQAYLRDAAQDLESLAAWARGRRVPPAVRLVKGAYWDTETLQAGLNGWAAPVFERKEHTDANYELLARRLLEHHGTLRATFATHNLRSLASAVTEARELAISDRDYEVQLLHGMAEPVHEAVRSMGLRLRVYAPAGELVPGMAYLVRRLLENTSNESFVRQHYFDEQSLEKLLEKPAAAGASSEDQRPQRKQTDLEQPEPYAPEPPARWFVPAVRAAFSAAVKDELRRPTRAVPAFVCGEKVRTGQTFESLDPGDGSSVIAEVVACGAGEVDEAVRCAAGQSARWAGTDPRLRVGLLFRAAALLRARRFELAALLVREVGKGWADSDAEVCEAIDYCEYYGRLMLRLADGGEVLSLPGEENRLSYRGRGVCAVIAPWNFPLAIPMGMVCAALAAGNCVVFKPAEQSPAVGWALFELLREAGIPKKVLSFLPGGPDTGAGLAGHRDIDTIAFTGSRQVGLAIAERAGARAGESHSIPRVVCELGGKNPILVDSDADLDEVVPAVLDSAFGFCGQRCSAAGRLIVVEKVHDAVVKRVAEASRSLLVASPRRAESQLGPLIDADASARMDAVYEEATRIGTVVSSPLELPATGWYVSPLVVTDLEASSWLAKEELFGPVLVTFRARDFREALEMANQTDALTAGVFSRSADHLELAASALRAGNVYLNRKTTGAVVGRQPFGGSGRSGTGFKAGGPDYLLQYLDARVVSENTLRQGFAPTEGEGASKLSEPRNGSVPSSDHQGDTSEGPGSPPVGGRGVA